MDQRSPYRQLAEFQVEDILSGRYSRREAAAMFGISLETVSRIRRGQVYRDVYERVTGKPAPIYKGSKRISPPDLSKSPSARTYARFKELYPNRDVREFMDWDGS